MIITDEQRIGLERDPRYRDVATQFVRNYGIFIVGNNGNPPPGAMTQVEWAQRRTIGAGVVQHPNSQDYNEWIAQFTMFLKGADVWVAPPDPLPEGETEFDATIDAMIAANKFDELAELTYGLRAKRIEF